jgi:hypothetical protein
MENPHKIDLLIPRDLIWCSTEIFDLDQIVGIYTRNKPTLRYLDAHKDRATFRLHKVPRGWKIHIAPLIEVNGTLTSELGNQTRVSAQATVNKMGLGISLVIYVLVSTLLVFTSDPTNTFSVPLKLAITLLLIGLVFVLTFFWIEYQKRQLLKLVRQALTEF